MQFQDQSSYLYGGSAGNLPLQHHLLHHHQQGFAHGRERFTGKDHVPELLFAEPAAEAGEQDLAAACKEVSSEGGGHMTKRRGRDGEGRGGGPRRADDRTTEECTVALSVGNLADANGMLLELSQTASPYASSCGERLVAARLR
jgi:hypothetical protein